MQIIKIAFYLKKNEMHYTAVFFLLSDDEALFFYLRRLKKTRPSFDSDRGRKTPYEHASIYDKIA